MNIIIIGNGFDLAHELPTEYADFLAFCKMLKEVYNVKRNDKQTQKSFINNFDITTK